MGNYFNNCDFSNTKLHYKFRDVSMVLNPKDISDQLQKMAVTVPGIRPGLQTNFYLKQVIKRITMIGATMLAVLTIVPNFIESTLNITGLNGLSTTSLLILA